MSPVRRLRIDLAYDGSGFAGFARQRDQRTVQGELETALSALVGHAVTTVVAGRTDRGVHASAQVVHVDVDPATPRARARLEDLELLRARLGHLVGRELAVWAVREVGPDFDARFSATARHYRYRLVDAVVADPLRRLDRWWVGAPLRLGPMREAARALVGEHDFAAFCRRAEGRTTIRRLDVLALSRPAPGRIDARLVGPAFCHQQVRAIVGCLVEVGRGRRAPGWVGEVLAGRDRARAAPLAPPHGLTLERVAYGRRWPAAEAPVDDA
jgi:tRNA pseudouridine38-40 synthase